jgi:hypothetical protein
MNNAMEQIQSLAAERFSLFRLAGKQHLSPEQLDRLHEIEGRLPGLWDLHRRELAAVRKPESPRSFAYFEAA